MLLHTNRVPSDLQPIFVSQISIFVNEGSPYNSCVPAFKFLVRNGYVKGRKVKELDVCDKVEILRFKMI